MAIVIALGWFAIGCIYAFQAAMLRRYDLSGRKQLQARRIHTQFQLFRRMLIAFVVIIDIGALLWTFNDATHLALGLRSSGLRRRRLRHPRHRGPIHRSQLLRRPPDRLHRTHPRR